MSSLTHPRAVWSVFALCLTVVLSVMAWVTTHTLRLEHSRQEAEAGREFEERLRLALWRLDSAAGGLVFAENARTPDQFKDFHEAEQLYTKAFQMVKKGQVLAPSPLLSAVPDYAKLYFEIHGDGSLTSPQVPVGNRRDLAEQNYTTTESIEAAAVWLGEMSRRFSGSWESLSPDGGPGQGAPASREASKPLSEEELRDDFVNRALTATQSGEWTSQGRAKIQTENTAALEQAASAGINLDRPDAAEPFEGWWRGADLFLRRMAYLDGEETVQFVWLKAAEIERMLLGQVGDLFPKATLVPAEDPLGAADAVAESRRMGRLVALPFLLVPGEWKAWPGPGWSSIRRSLTFAWICVLLAAGVAGALVAGIVGLSERRAAFVSAVTHEMRTPLTTFRLYSELLARDMVRGQEKRKEYLTTLTSEADRLGHLVENVLAYARVEKGHAPRARSEHVCLWDLVERLRPRLERRADEAGVAFAVELQERARNLTVCVDLTAVEQILFNLVDNACKYGVPSEGERRIHFEADGDARSARLTIRDHGRGISPVESRRLFRPFEKSAHAAAHSAPGVGLGLALCRKLSRALGGDLELCREAAPGACFVLSLPVKQAGG